MGSRLVYKSRCAECLFGKDRLVSPERAKEMIANCQATNSYFVCHKDTLKGEDARGVMCRGYFDRVWAKDEIGQMLVRAGVPEFVEQETDCEPLIPFRFHEP